MASGCQRLLACACAVGLATSLGYGQSMRFETDVMGTRESDTSARVDVYVQIPYAQLTFVREGTMYVAGYEIMVQFRSRADSLIREKTFLESIREPEYDVTIGRTGKVEFLQKLFSMPAGDYSVVVTLTDDNAHRSVAVTRALHVPDYAHASLAMSSLLFASAIADVGGKRSITPMIARDVSAMRQGTFVFFETYSKQRDTFDVGYAFTTESGKQEVFRSARIPIGVESGTTRQFVKVQTDVLSQGAYLLTLSLLPHSRDRGATQEADSVRATMTHSLAVEWGTGIPQTEADIDRAVSMLRWIATANDEDSIRTAPTTEAKRDAYKRFWDRRDPTPGTERNEAMELYLSRIHYANDHFKGLGGDGYATDQGMIYVIFGEPSSTESHPFDYINYGIYRGPYVVWFYQRYSRNFVFINQDGFGDFRLASPPPVERFRYGY